MMLSQLQTFKAKVVKHSNIVIVALTAKTNLIGGKKLKKMIPQTEGKVICSQFQKIITLDFHQIHIC